MGSHRIQRELTSFELLDVGAARPTARFAALLRQGEHANGGTSLRNRYLAGFCKRRLCRGIAVPPARLLKLNGACWCNVSCVAGPACQLSARAREPCLHCTRFILRGAYDCLQKTVTDRI
jgi:hypothetical protein